MEMKTGEKENGKSYQDQDFEAVIDLKRFKIFLL
jgi:hypothetical protein